MNQMCIRDSIKAALNNHLEIVAVCDVLPEKMEALLAKYDLAGDASIQRYTDYRQMLAEHDLTLVSIEMCIRDRPRLRRDAGAGAPRPGGGEYRVPSYLEAHAPAAGVCGP